MTGRRRGMRAMEGGEERMYLDPIYWVMDNSSLWLLEEKWREGGGGKKRKRE